MRPVVRILFACALATALAAGGGCTLLGSTPKSPGSGPVAATLIESDNGSTVTLDRGATLEVRLGANPTTGFDWHLAGALPAQLTSPTTSFESTAQPGLVGAGGATTLRFTAASPGSGTLKLTYNRPWEKDVAPERTFAVTVVVK
jgi:inhibitor of cysteine peptidase